MVKLLIECLGAVVVVLLASTIIGCGVAIAGRWLRISLLLALTTTALHAQTNTLTITNYPHTNAIYLWVRNASAASNALAKLDTALGYPNAATKTDRAVEWQLLSNGTNALVRLDLSDVYSPKHGRYVDIQARVKEQLTDTQWGTAVCTNASQLSGRAVARVSGKLARQIGSFMTRTNAP